MQMSKLKVDLSASKTVFPILNVDLLKEIFVTFPIHDNVFSIIEYSTFGGAVLSLRISSKRNENKFPIYFGTDIYSQSQPQPTVMVKWIDFFLCFEDITIIKETKRDFFHSEMYLKLLDDFNRVDVTRRDNGLIGNNILQQCSSIKHDNIEFFFEKNEHKLGSLSWEGLTDICDTIHAMNYIGANTKEADSLNEIFPNDFIFKSNSIDLLEPYKEEI
jgi:hypothetical protein